MSPIIGARGGLSASAYGLFSAGGVAETNSYESIATVTGSGSSVTFNLIPSTYKHLQIRLIGRIDRSGEASDFFTIRYNSDTGSSYSWHALEGSGTTLYAESTASTSLPRCGDIAATTAASGIFGIGIIDILDYTNTTKYKTTRNFTGRDANGTGWVWFGSSLWRDTAAISRIDILPTFGTGFQANTHFALYGIKG
jgi:hypothetical protein